MKPLQKGILSVLVLFSVTAVSAVGFTLFPKVGMGAQQPEPQAAATGTPEPTEISAVAIVSTPDTTQTPFQPVPNTPTFTPSPTPTLTPSPTNTPLPTATPTLAFPKSVYIEGIWGFPQTFNLSCESRSASDLARFFGVSFTELEFLYALPASDNPDHGFVGDVRGYLGQLPPLGHGVHADPVANLMQQFGLDARARHGMELEDVKKELAAGRPVMIWAISNLGTSQPVEYIDSNGETAIVARFEHTFIVIGYDQKRITVLDNEKIYSVTTSQFLSSWDVLGNMGIVIRE